MRGFSGEHVAEYLEAASSTFTVGEYWDSLQYTGGVPDFNQVTTSMSPDDFNQVTTRSHGSSACQRPLSLASCRNESSGGFPDFEKESPALLVMCNVCVIAQDLNLPCRHVTALTQDS